MADHVSRKRRSEIMSNIKGKHTLPEIVARKSAHKLGLRFRLHRKELPGRPDMVFARWQTALFVNGCFWHHHQHCKKSALPKSNTQFWERKIEQNVKRDLRNYATLKEQGWKVVVLWQCEIKTVEQASVLLKRHFRMRS